MAGLGAMHTGRGMLDADVVASLRPATDAGASADLEGIGPWNMAGACVALLADHGLFLGAAECPECSLPLLDGGAGCGSTATTRCQCQCAATHLVQMAERGSALPRDPDGRGPAHGLPICWKRHAMQVVNEETAEQFRTITCMQCGKCVEEDDEMLLFVECPTCDLRMCGECQHHPNPLLQHPARGARVARRPAYLDVPLFAGSPGFLAAGDRGRRPTFPASGAFAALVRALCFGDTRVPDVLEYLKGNGLLLSALGPCGLGLMFWACTHGSVGAARVLLDLGLGADTRCSAHGQLPLQVAAKEGHLALCEFLVGQGASVNRVVAKGVYPIYAACGRGHLDVVKFLAEANADVNQGRSLDGQTSLFVAAQEGFLGVAEFLCDHGVDLNKPRQGDGATPLLMAAQLGHAEIVTLLIKRGADCDQACVDGEKPVAAASRNGHLGILAEFAAHGVDMNACDNDGCTALHCAAAWGQLEAVRFLVQHDTDVNAVRIKDGSTALFMAAQNGYAAVVRELHACGADVNRACTDDGQSPVFAAANADHAEVVELLVRIRADVNQPCFSELGEMSHETPLYAACSLQRSTVARLLIDGGASINHAVNPTNFTPLHVAMSEGCQDVVRLLLRHRANPEAQDRHLSTPLWCGAMKSRVDVVQILAAYGADINHRGWADMTVWNVRKRQFPRSKDADFVQMDAWYSAVRTWSPLRIAVAARLHTDFRFLLGSGRVGRNEVSIALLDTARATAPWEAGPGPETETLRLVRCAIHGWSPRAHQIFGIAFRTKVEAVLLCVQRAGNNVCADAAAALNGRSVTVVHLVHQKMPPYEIWTSFILRYAAHHEDFHAFGS